VGSEDCKLSAYILPRWCMDGSSRGVSLRYGVGQPAKDDQIDVHFEQAFCASRYDWVLRQMIGSSAKPTTTILLAVRKELSFVEAVQNIHKFCLELILRIVAS
jgi:hypothetical protein